MTGQRLADGSDWPAPNGAYWKDDRGAWMCVTPIGQFGNLSAHQVTEHDDGTVTVSPSILVRGGSDVARTEWHGYLERGVWREC